MKQKMAELITKDMTIGEVVEKYPDAAEVLTNFGLHCIGCHVSPFETIEQGSMGHGMDEATIAEMIKEANKVAKAVKIAPKKKADMHGTDIAFTPKAIEKLRKRRARISGWASRQEGVLDSAMHYHLKKKRKQRILN